MFLEQIHQDDYLTMTFPKGRRLKDQGVNQIATIGYCLGGRVTYIANVNIRSLLTYAVSYYGGCIAPVVLLQHTFQEINLSLSFHHKKYTCVQFSDADHGFFCDEHPSYNAVAAKLSWSLTLAFFQEHFNY